MRIIRGLAGTVGVLLAVAGLALALALGPDSTWGGEPAPVDAGEAAVVTTNPGLLNVAGITLRVRAEGEGEVFVGAGNPVDVESYLDGVAAREITRLGPDGVDTAQARDGDDGLPSPEAPGLELWDHESQGDGQTTLDVPLTDAEPVQVVAMPTASDGAAPQVGLGYRVEGGFIIGLGLVVVGLGMLVGVVVLGRRARRDRGTVAPAPAAPAAEPVDGTRLRRVRPVRVLAVTGAVGMLAGCGVPHEVERAEPLVVPMTADDAARVMSGYDERNDAAIAASSKGDGSRWKTADTGPLLLHDDLAARITEAVGDEEGPGTAVHRAEGVVTAAQPEYPLWSLVHGEVTWTDEDEKAGEPAPEAWMMLREEATGEWKQLAGVDLHAELPATLPADEAAPAETDLARAAEVDELVQTWFEDGTAEGLEVPEAATDARATLLAKKEGFRSTAAFAQPWPEGRTAPGGAVRVARVEDGLLVHTVQAWSMRADVASGYHVRYGSKYDEVYGRGAYSTGYYEEFYAGSTLVHVPATGPARVLGTGTAEIREQPR